MSSRAKQVLTALRQYLILPKLMRLSISAPKDRTVAWDRYWAGITRTGARSDVLWDSGTDHELLGYGDVLRRHFDPGLPLVDVGCGHGAFSRALTAYSPKVLGVDVSAHAVARARDESAGVGVSYLARDMTEPGAGASLVESTDANAFVRGVLHVLAPADQAALMENLRQLVGARGTVFLAETNFQGNPVEYVAHLGASLRSIPAPLELAIRKLPMPGRFGPEELARVMPKGRWTLVEDGAATIETNPLMDAAGNSRIPGYFAVLKPKNSDAGRSGSS
ncbi:UNVERIFIED_ORG: 2-polyprenyl-3-methyl-5-hydroxy-6-metoxy-1,4-benzoquinol methylase [Arthrobacter sp. UYEF2]